MENRGRIFKEAMRPNNLYNCTEIFNRWIIVFASWLVEMFRVKLISCCRQFYKFSNWRLFYSIYILYLDLAQLLKAYIWLILSKRLFTVNIQYFQICWHFYYLTLNSIELIKDNQNRLKINFKNRFEVGKTFCQSVTNQRERSTRDLIK